MKKYLLIALILFTQCTDIPQDEESHAFEALNYEQLLEKISQEDEQLYVVNFWATWCVPCVEELPHFMEVNREFKDRGVKFVLVSLDKSDQLTTGVKNMKENLQLDADIYLLDDVKNMNRWIPATDEKWTGAIPATLFYKNGKKLSFIEGQLSKSELRTRIQKHL